MRSRLDAALKDYCNLEEKHLECLTGSDVETIRLGQDLGWLLTQGDLVALAGPLGSGKTCFAKGLALGLGVDPKTVVTSPSFALVNEYQGTYPFFHMDVFRLELLSEFILAGLDEYLHCGGVVAMEWADRWPEILPEHRIGVEFHIHDEHSRRIVLSGRHPRACKIIETLKGKGYSVERCHL